MTKAKKKKATTAKINGEYPIQPGELLRTFPTGAGATRAVAVYAAAWHYMSTNRGDDLVCGLRPAADDECNWDAVDEHVWRARLWLEEHPEDAELVAREPVNRCYLREIRVFEAILRTRHEDVDVLVNVLSPTWKSLDDGGRSGDWMQKVLDRIASDRAAATRDEP